MPPVEIVNEKKGARKRLKFLRNTSYEGSDYGPDHKTDEADVDARWSAVFLANGRAVEAADEKAPETGKVQVRDPEPQDRDPELPLKKN